MNPNRFKIFSARLARLVAAPLAITRAALFSAFAVTCSAQQTTVPAPTPWTITARSANSRIWQRTTYELSPTGQSIPHLHQYTELGTGICYQQPGGDGSWLDSQELVNILQDGSASATNGEHQAYFPVDIYDGNITLITPDGLQLTSQPAFLCYDDGTNVAIIGSLTNSVGSLAASNVVIYPTAFTGIDADLRYTYRKSGFEQEIVINRQLPQPEAFGLSSASANLEMVTEFFNAPEPAQSASVAGPNGLTDVTLTFDSMKMIRGKAFSIGDSRSTAGICVWKQWAHVGSQTFLIEALPYEQVAPDLSGLPPASSAIKMRRAPVKKALMARILPQAYPRPAAPHWKRMASASWNYKSGVVLDYQQVLGNQTNVTFQSDLTYYISGNVDLFGTNLFEPGTILKYATNACVYQTGGKINWNGGAYSPVILTAKDDDSVGETISGSTGNPLGTYANPEALGISSMLSTSSISYFRISDAAQAIYITSSDLVNLYNGQIINCQTGINALYSDLYLGNVLLANVGTNFSFDYEMIDAENVTFSESTYLAYGGYGSANFNNCIFANVAHLTNSAMSATFSGDVNGFYDSPEFGVAQVTNTFYPFETVGAGGYYLTNGCAFTNAGSAGISPALLADLRQRPFIRRLFFQTWFFPLPQI